MSRVPTAGPPIFTAFIRDITEQKRMVKQLAFRATHDGLTSVLNNATFMERLTLAAEIASPSFLAIHPSRRFLYAVGEMADGGGKKTGAIHAFALDPRFV